MNMLTLGRYIGNINLNVPRPAPKRGLAPSSLTAPIHTGILKPYVFISPNILENSETISEAIERFIQTRVAEAMTAVRTKSATNIAFGSVLFLKYRKKESAEVRRNVMMPPCEN